MTGARQFARWGLWFGGALILLAAVLIGIDVLMRKFLDRSIVGADELAGYALAIAGLAAFSEPSEAPGARAQPRHKAMRSPADKRKA